MAHNPGGPGTLPDGRSNDGLTWFPAADNGVVWRTIPPEILGDDEKLKKLLVDRYVLRTHGRTAWVPCQEKPVSSDADLYSLFDFASPVTANVAVDLEREARTAAIAQLKADFGIQNYAKIQTEFETRLEKEGTKKAQNSATVRPVRLMLVNIDSSQLLKRFDALTHGCPHKTSVLLSLVGHIVTDHKADVALSDSSLIATAFAAAVQAVYPPAEAAGIDAKVTANASAKYSESIKRKIAMTTTASAPTFFQSWYMADRL